ncbi:flagellar basal body-associated FliL family protein [Aestuariivirga litoralis]|uniref:flagellar basal body-associated FliL family protein n=1 Tax=Aestuariivirga litoralis TaxID=2650924 RepID=UPI0018C74582|nr:flagellar basal body-associated FliL family protein [Aestuariivirga litoralis]MBG1233191.1 hypothetical protein [Aestuariivirga litoralis]
MADSEKKGGLMQLVVPLLVVGLAGVGTGFGVSKFMAKPKVEPAATDASATADAGGHKTESKEKPAGEKKAEGDHKSDKSESDAVHSAGLLVDQQKAMVVDMKDTTFAPMAPVIANLTSPPNSWIRIEGAIAVKRGGHDKPEEIVNLVAPKILDYLKTLSIEQVQGADNLAFLNMDLNEIVRESSEGQARAILVTGFVVE